MFLQSYLIPYALPCLSFIIFILRFISLIHQSFCLAFLLLSFCRFIALMLLRFNMFLPPTFLDPTFPKLKVYRVYLNFIVFISFCFDLLLIFFFVAAIPLFYFLRIVCPILPVSLSKRLSQVNALSHQGPHRPFLLHQVIFSLSLFHKSE